MVDKIQMIGTAFLPIDKSNKKILVSKRSMNKKYFPGYWEVIGGNLEFGGRFYRLCNPRSERRDKLQYKKSDTFTNNVS